MKKGQIKERPTQLVSVDVTVKNNLKWLDKFKLFLQGYFYTDIKINVVVLSDGSYELRKCDVEFSFNPPHAPIHYPENNTNQ